jgi:hypothetical protein
MKSRLIIALLIGGVLLVNCKEDKKTEGTSVTMEEVMAIHDEVMPKMGSIGKLVATLKPMVDTTQAGQAYGKAMKDLQESHEAMMDWMQGFGRRFDSDEIMNGKPLTAEKKQWLREEAEKMKEVKEQINTSISQAEELLGKE